ncbi:MFS transporter [Limoniibacter endophyticus]|uniref:MFS transporter n=1 Tax=Limoniibacter endophyticus TaxID=1565040 RepID=A0A8J3GIR5_9HYPH|nr:MFS transporter [Limoniibacter endophyticus]GHC80304.1 MFS transporter [Limoniibacter endophyticus]
MAYALPALPLALLSLPFYATIPIVYAEEIGLSPASIGFVLALALLLGVFTDPLIGLLSDNDARWLGSWSDLGRRRGFFAISLPITAIAALMILWPSANAGIIYFAFWAALLSIGQSATMLPYAAWGAELATDYEGRVRVSAYREATALGGISIILALPFFLDFATPLEDFSALAAVALFILIGLPLLGVLAISKLPEPQNRSSCQLAFVEGLRAVSENRPFVRLLAAYFINGLANGVPATLLLYFIVYRVGRPDMQGAVLFVCCLAAFAGVPLALGAAKLFGKHKAWCLAMIISCAAFTLTGFLKEGEFGVFIALSVVTGFMLGFDLSLPPAIQADVIDSDTATSGSQRTGFYFSLWGLATKGSLALAVGLVFPALALAGFDPVAQVKTEESLLALTALYAWLPPVLKAFAVSLMWNFPIDQEEQMRLERVIQRSSRGVR